MEFVKGFRDLEVCKLARQLSKEIFDISMTFPKEETYSLTDQVRRSSRSVGAQIAEAWGKRRYQKHFVSTDAVGEELETQHWIEAAQDCAYLSPEKSTSVQTRKFCNIPLEHLCEIKCRVTTDTKFAQRSQKKNTL